MEDSTSSNVSYPSYDIEQMCTPVMYVLIDEMKTSRPQRIEFNRDVVWEGARSIPGVFKE